MTLKQRFQKTAGIKSVEKQSLTEGVTKSVRASTLHKELGVSERQVITRGMLERELFKLQQIAAAHGMLSEAQRKLQQRLIAEINEGLWPDIKDAWETGYNAVRDKQEREAALKAAKKAQEKAGGKTASTDKLPQQDKEGPQFRSTAMPSPGAKAKALGSLSPETKAKEKAKNDDERKVAETFEPDFIPKERGSSDSDDSRDNPNALPNPRKYLDILKPEYRAKKERELTQADARMHISHVLGNAKLKQYQDDLRKEKQYREFDPMIEGDSEHESGINRKDRRSIQQQIQQAGESEESKAKSEKALKTAQDALLQTNPTKARMLAAEKQRRDMIAAMRAKHEADQAKKAASEEKVDENASCGSCGECNECMNNESVDSVLQEMEQEIQEMSTTAGVAGYNTPGSFSKPGQHSHRGIEQSKKEGWEVCAPPSDQRMQMRKAIQELKDTRHDTMQERVWKGITDEFGDYMSEQEMNVIYQLLMDKLGLAEGGLRYRAHAKKPRASVASIPTHPEDK